MDGGGRSRREHVIESNAGAIADDCMDAGDRAMQEQLPSAYLFEVYFDKFRSDFAKSALKGTRSVPCIGSTASFHSAFQVFSKALHGC
jgi:hypothetical protein